MKMTLYRVGVTGLFYGGLYLFSCPLLVFHNFIFSETTWVIITLQKQKQKSNENQKQNKKAILVSQNKHCSPTTTSPHLNKFPVFKPQILKNNFMNNYWNEDYFSLWSTFNSFYQLPCRLFHKSLKVVSFLFFPLEM